MFVFFVLLEHNFIMYQNLVARVRNRNRLPGWVKSLAM